MARVMRWLRWPWRRHVTEWRQGKQDTDEFFPVPPHEMRIAPRQRLENISGPGKPVPPDWSQFERGERWDTGDNGW